MRTLGVVLACSLLAACEGPAGPPGPPGEQGPPGSSGLDVERSTYCEGEISQGGVFSYVAGFSIVEYTNGGVFVSCSVFDSTAESSRSQYFAPGQVGAQTPGCAVVLDVDTPNGGIWVFERDSQGLFATYNDSQSSNDGFVADLADCAEYLP